MRPFRSKAFAGLVFAGVAGCLLVIALVRPNDRDLWGDEGTYVAMTASLAEDGDLVFDETDLERIVAHPDTPSPTVILQRTGRGITFSKPLLYPLISVPLYSVMGEGGMVATNLLLLLISLYVAWSHLCRLADSEQARWTLRTFAFCSVIVAYIGWKMSDLALLALTLIGLILALGGREIQNRGGLVRMPFGGYSAAILAGLILGAAVTMRYTTAALAAAAVAALVFDKRWRRGIVVAALALIGFLAVTGLSTRLQGTGNPYKAERSSFNQEIGYPAGERSAAALEQFSTRPATQSATWLPRFDSRRTAYSTLYFFVGRHTGVLLYFPAALVFALVALRRLDRISLPLLGGVFAIVGFYLVWMPENYFGGSTFVGNRYFLGAFPALLVAMTQLPSRRSLNVAWLIALVGWGSAAYSTWAVRDLDNSSQAHSFAGVFRRLPFESTAQRIDGLEDRFWSEDFVRFLDPFAATARSSFRLDANHPEAQILVATAQEDRPLLFVVSPSSTAVELSVRESGNWDHFTLPLALPKMPGIVEIPTSKPWRRHSYWWKPPGRMYDSRILRFSLASDVEEGATAVVRYAGKGRELAPLSAELVQLEPGLPTAVTAGSKWQITARFRNTGRRPWKPDGIFPIKISQRWVIGNQGQVVAQDAAALSMSVSPGETVEIPITLLSPEEPGDYHLALDLIREPQGALGRLGRTVLLTEVVRVELEPSPDTPAP